MSKQLSQNQNTELQVLLEISRNLVPTVQNHEVRIAALEKTSVCDSRKRQKIKQRAEQHVSQLLGGKGADRYKEAYRTTISALWHDFWNTFGVTSYHDTPALMYDTALQYIDDWRPRPKLVSEEVAE